MRDDHWLKKGCPPTDFMKVGEANVIDEPLVAREKNHHFTTAYQTWFNEAVCENLACNWGLLQLYLQCISCFDHQKAESRHF